MSSKRPACEIEPVLPTASRSLILPGPRARSEPKSTRTVNRMSLMGHPAPENGRNVSTDACRLRSRGDRFGRLYGQYLDGHQCRQAGKARRAQRHVGLAHQPARPFHGAYCVVADAINREHRNVGATDEARDERGVVLEAAVVVQKAAIRPLHQTFELRNLIAAAAHIENAEMLKIKCLSILSFGR